jgi:hypothetical protein
LEIDRRASNELCQRKNRGYVTALAEAGGLRLHNSARATNRELLRAESSRVAPNASAS